MKKLVVGLLLATSAIPAHASPVSFSYLFATTGQTASGVLEGSLGGDSIFTIASVTSFAVDGVAVADSFNLQSANAAYLGINDAAALKLDGSYLNFAIFNQQGTQVFAAGVTSEFQSLAGEYLVGATTGYGGNGSFNPYVQANFSALADDVPEPAMLGLFGLGAIGLALSRRRRAA